jgi:hypothetical protein
MVQEDALAPAHAYSPRSITIGAQERSGLERIVGLRFPGGMRSVCDVPPFAVPISV